MEAPSFYNAKVYELKDSSKYSGLPFKETDPAKKDKKWFRTICEYGYNAWIKGTTVIPYSRRNDLWLNRLYGQDAQPTTKYLERLSVKDRKTGERKFFGNISNDNEAVYQKFVRIYLSMMKEAKHDMAVYANDASSSAEREEKKWQTWAKIQLEGMGIQMQAEDMPVKPRNMQQLEMLYSAPNTLLKEIAFNKCIEDSLYISNWDDIETEIYLDFLNCGFAGHKDYVEDGKICARYVDMINYITLATHRRTFELSPFNAEVKAEKLSVLRPQLIEAGYTEEDISKIANRYSAVAGNALFTFGMNMFNNYYNQYGFYPYDQFIVWYMDAEFDSNDEWEGSMLNVKKKCKWIIGTEMIWEEGNVNDMPRETTQKGKYKDYACGTYHVYKVADRSITETCISSIDEIQLAVRKIRNESATKSGKKVIVDIPTIQNLNIGGDKELKPMEVMKIMDDTGRLYYRSTTHHSQVINPNASRPVAELEGGIGNYLNELIFVIQRCENVIRGAIGLNEVTDASTPNPKLPVGIGESMQAATNRALQPMYAGALYLKVDFAKNVIRRIQARKDGFEYYRNILGDALFNAIDSSYEDAECQIQVVPVVTDEEKKLIMDAAVKALSVPLEQGGISYANYFEVYNYVQKGNYYSLKMAELLLSYYVEENIKRAQDNQQQNIQAQGQQNIQLQQQVAAADKEKADMETQRQLALLQAEAEINDARDAKLHQYKMEELGLQHTIVKQGKDNQTAGMLQAEELKAHTKIINQEQISSTKLAEQNKEHQHEISETEKERQHETTLAKMKPKRIAA